MSAFVCYYSIRTQLTIGVAWQVVQGDALAEVDGSVIEGLPVSATNQYSYQGRIYKDTHKPSFR
jgi:hypothetical protein